ncbi:MAG: efflux RND transporter permease subunit [Endozoicomonas sp. (ex Botrylloides leachii)]|nr:efflux RND transporter permease subunit [Endozoicomonas sp. (ex Botrylloides leachii)]
MNLPELCIRRPVMATMLSLVLVISGLIAFFKLGYNYFPNSTLPTITINTSYSGASSKFMSDEVTQKEESALTDIDGIDYILSSSEDGKSSITVMLKDDTPYFETVNKIRNKIAGVQSKLPEGLDGPPSVSDNTGTTWDVVPTLNMAFTGKDGTSIRAIYDYLINNVVPQLQNIEGVGQTPLFGTSSVALRVWLDIEKMANLKVTPEEVADVLKNNTESYTAGTIESGHKEYTLVPFNTLQSPTDYANLIVRYSPNNPVRLQDIADVTWGTQNLTISPTYYNGKQAISLQIRPFRNANPVEIAHRVLNVLDTQIKPKLPQNISLHVTYNQATFIKDAINASYSAVVEAIILVSLIILLFLGSLYSAAVPVVTIPVCLIATFAVMNLLGFTINTVTLMAIVLAIGLVVDDAIVVLENTHRYIEKGQKSYLAAINGSKSIAFSVVAMTLTVVAVYMPLVFSSGITAKVFKEFGITLSAAVFISGFVAMTLSPMMCSRLMHKTEKQHSWFIKIESILKKLTERYGSLLTHTFSSGKVVLGSFITIIVLGIFLFQTLGQDMIPKEDTGYLETKVTEPPNSNQAFTNDNMALIDQVIAKEPEIANNMSYWIPGGATNFLTLKPWSERKDSTDTIINRLNSAFKADVPAVDASASLPNPVDYGYGASKFQLEITTLDKDPQSLLDSSNKIVAALKQYPGLKNVTSSLVFDTRQYNIQINLERLSQLGVDPTSVRSALSDFLAGNHVTDIKTADDSIYPVYIQAKQEYLNNFNILKDIRVKANDGSLVPLSQFVIFKPATAQPSIKHFNRKIGAEITATFAPGYSMGEVRDYADKHIGHLLKDNESYAYTGALREQAKSQSDSLFYFALGLLLVYMILAAQFESFIDPLIIIITVPLSLFGALLTLHLIGGTLNVFTNIGLLTLIGLVTKQGILIVQFANERLNEGISPQKAAIEAAQVRLRPILMTSLTMIIGTLPLALASGPGSVARSQIGWTLSGGMLIGTVLTLFAIPLAYSQAKSWGRNRYTTP